MLCDLSYFVFFFFFKQKTAYEMRISDWSSDVCSSDLAASKPALVLLGLGGNDMLRGIDAAETRANLDAMLAELKRRDIPVLLTGMVAAPNLGADYAKAFDPIYSELAPQYGPSLYPIGRASGRESVGQSV